QQQQQQQQVNHLFTHQNVAQLAQQMAMTPGLNPATLMPLLNALTQPQQPQNQNFDALHRHQLNSLQNQQSLEQMRQHQRNLLEQRNMMAAAEAAARSRPSLLGDLPGYARQQPITLLGSAAGTAAAAASALAAPQISGTGASLLHAAAGQHSLLTAAAAAAAAAAAVKPHVVIQQPSLLGGAQATGDGAAADDDDDDDDEAPQIQMEMEMEEEEEAQEESKEMKEKISELVKHSAGAVQVRRNTVEHQKPKASVGAANGFGSDEKEEMNSDSSDEEEDANPARSKAWNMFFRKGAIYKVAEEYGNDLYHSIIAENRAKSAEYQKKMGMENRPPQPALYREPSQAPRIEELMAKIEMSGPAMIRAIRKKREEEQCLKNDQAIKVCEAQRDWAVQVEAWENSPRKKKQDEKHREIFERAFPDIKGNRSSVAAQSRSGWLSAPPPAERVLRGALGTLEEDEKMRHGISIPPCQQRRPDEGELFEQGLNETNVIENCFDEHKKRMANWQLKWQVRERNAFKLAFQNYPKNFCAIAYHLPEKTTRNCVQFYYMTKLDNPSFKICHRQYQNKKRRKANQSRPYKPPAMPNALDVASIQASVQDANDRLPPAPVGKQPELKCSSCSVVMEPSTASTTRITRANLEALGVDAENSRICEKCRVLAANSRGGRCPIKGCTGSKRKIKSTKPFPAEYVKLEDAEKKFILEQIEIHIDTVKICHLCVKRVAKEVQKLKGAEYDDAYAAFCEKNGYQTDGPAVKCEEMQSDDKDAAVGAAAAAAATPSGRKGSGRSEDKEEKAWTDDETARLLDLNGKYGNDWRAIATRMRGRNEEECRLQLVRSTKQSPPPGEDERRSPSVKEEAASVAGSLLADRSREEEEDAEKGSTTPVPGLVPCFGGMKSSASSDVTTSTAGGVGPSASMPCLKQEEGGIKQ
ncbi:gei-8, partial [Pristionchus pacificus]|uniref:Gei-8 n=1 Tax=Pristionchus pacificus TaxID=54126 RepID=A0A2A6CEB2_PRIPA